MQQLQQGAKSREFSDAAAMMRHYREVQARTWAPKPVQVRPRTPSAAAVAAPAQPSPEPLPDVETAAAAEPARLAPGAFLGNLHNWGPRRTPALRIIAQVAACHGFTVDDILGPSRKGPVITARQDAMIAVFLGRIDLTFPMIGRIFHRDHSTVVHAVKRRGLLRARDALQAAAEARAA